MNNIGPEPDSQALSTDDQNANPDLRVINESDEKRSRQDIEEAIDIATDRLITAVAKRRRERLMRDAVEQSDDLTGLAMPEHVDPRENTEEWDPVGLALGEFRMGIAKRPNNNLPMENEFPTYLEAHQYATENCGIVILPGEYRDETLFAALEMIGVEFRWNPRSARLEIERGKGWEYVDRNGDLIRDARNEVTRHCAVIRKLPTPPGIKKDSPQDTPRYAIERINHSKSWGYGGDALYKAIVSLVGTLVPEVDPLLDWVHERLERIRAMPQSERDRLVNGLDNVFTEMPGYRFPDPIHERMARKCGRFFYTMIGHRLLQAHPRFKDRMPRSQPFVPVIVGAPEIGKSTVARMLIPTDLPDGYGVMPSVRFSQPPEEIKRRLATSLSVLLDDIDNYAGKVGAAQSGIIKELITETILTFRWLYREHISVAMPCVYIGTANSMQLPRVDGMERRFAPFKIEVHREPGETEEDIIKRSEKRINAHRDNWIIAGLILAIENDYIGLGDEGKIDRRKAILASAPEDGDSAEINAIVTEMMASGRFTQGEREPTPAIAEWQVAQRMGWLTKRPTTLETDASAIPRTIPATDTDTPSDDLKIAWDNFGAGKDRRVNQICDVMSRHGWTMTKNRKRSIQERGRAGIVDMARVFVPPADWEPPAIEETERPRSSPPPMVIPKPSE